MTLTGVVDVSLLEPIPVKVEEEGSVIIPGKCIKFKICTFFDKSQGLLTTKNKINTVVASVICSWHGQIWVEMLDDIYETGFPLKILDILVSVARVCVQEDEDGMVLTLGGFHVLGKVAVECLAWCF